MPTGVASRAEKMMRSFLGKKMSGGFYLGFSGLETGYSPEETRWSRDRQSPNP
ncbi:hypothetical protein Syun_017591 [Stephania yunnanensis]|uniref:Uncharacterized protein n=1 Tax=Stephania yunnanensis TaxID=152371 RepID=A0AAP0J7C8_9MAGN